MNLMMRVLKEEEGQALTEYGLILGLIAVVTVGALTMMGTNVNKMLSSIANTLSATGK
ncbi:Flp family type IVb pilin [bacterium]|nr:Flp family type IVb pilin [bacterium]